MKELDAKRPSSGHNEHVQKDFRADDGLVITYDFYPAAKPQAVIQLVHGVGEHAARYTELASILSSHGFTVYASDQRGHGRTGMTQWGGDTGKIGQLGPGGVRSVIGDLVEFGQFIRAEHPDLPLVFLGHSWGSLMGQIILNSHADHYSAAVLSGTAYRVLGSMNSGDLNKKYRRPGATGAEWLSRDQDVANQFLADPLTTLVPLQKLFGLIDSSRLLGRPSRTMPRDIPILIQVGEEDPLGGGPSARRLEHAYRKRSKITDITTISYAGARHEVYNETNRAEVIDDLVAWLQERFPGRGE